jgi:hypothetical protein
MNYRAILSVTRDHVFAAVVFFFLRQTGEEREGGVENDSISVVERGNEVRGVAVIPPGYLVIATSLDGISSLVDVEVKGVSSSFIAVLFDAGRIGKPAPRKTTESSLAHKTSY